MEVRKSDGSYEQYDKRKLTNVIKKVYKGAELEYTPETANNIISNQTQDNKNETNPKANKSNQTDKS